MVWIGRIFALAASTQLAWACAPVDILERPARSDAELAIAKLAFRADQQRRLDALTHRVVDRMEIIADGGAKDDTYDMLLLSGGGDWGVFGAAFLRGWGDNAEMPRPEFDYVAGISTGAYISTYTISGAPERYARMEELYLNFDPASIHSFNPLGAIVSLLEKAPSILDSSVLRDMVEKSIDDELIEDIVAADDERRSLVIGAVNLDMGAFNAFEIGSELKAAEDPRERLVSILLASSAIPALLKPVEIDGDLYVDGGAAVGVPIFRVDAIQNVQKIWRSRRGKEKPPKVRFWVLLNNKIGVRPMVTQTRWSDVLLRSYKVALQTSLVPPIFALSEEVEKVDAQEDMEIEVRWTAIPEEFDGGPATSAFEPSAMQALSALGDRMGRDANSWREDPPSF